jgi:hypothetical protein
MTLAEPDPPIVPLVRGLIAPDTGPPAAGDAADLASALADQDEAVDAIGAFLPPQARTLIAERMPGSDPDGSSPAAGSALAAGGDPAGFDAADAAPAVPVASVVEPPRPDLDGSGFGGSGFESDPVGFDRAMAFAGSTAVPIGGPTLGQEDEVVGDGGLGFATSDDSSTIDDASTLVVTDPPPADPGAGAIDDPTPTVAPDDEVVGDGDLGSGAPVDDSMTIDDGSTLVVTDPPPADFGAGAIDDPAPIAASGDDVIVGDGNVLFDPMVEDGSITIADTAPIAASGDDLIVGDGNVLFDPPVDDGSMTIDDGPDENIDYGGYAGTVDDLDVR